jgi:hypothetical protein
MLKWWATKKSKAPDPIYEHVDRPDSVGVVISDDGRTVEINANGQRVLFISNVQQLFVQDQLTGMSYIRNLRLEAA